MSNSNVPRCHVRPMLLPIVLSAMLLMVTSVLAQPFDSAGLDIMPTSAVFKVITLEGVIMNSLPVSDPSTIIGRSNPQCDNSAAGYWSATIFGGGEPAFPGTDPLGDPCRRPSGFLQYQNCSRFVCTEMLSLNLSSAGFSIKAGTDYWVSASPAARNMFYRNSFGLVSSYLSNERTDTCCLPPPNGNLVEDRDFQNGADSYFNVYAEVEFSGFKTYNLTPMVMRNPWIGRFPPILDLPQQEYVHEMRFQGVALYDEDGAQWGYLLGDAHGGSGGGPIPSSSNAPLLVKTTQPVLFTVDAGTWGLPAGVGMPNDVHADSGSAAQQVTVYQTAGYPLGDGPNQTNVSQSALIGAGGFASDDAINSFSFGRDGSVDPVTLDALQAAVYFSVDRSAIGEFCTDVWYCSQSGAGRQAGAVFVERAFAGPFGLYADLPVPGETSTTGGMSGSNEMAVDGTAFGLMLPSFNDSTQGDVTGLELSEFETCDRWYGTFTGQSFTNQQATIFVWDQSGPFQPADLDTFAIAGQMGLQEGDIIDALVLSDVTADSIGGWARPIPNGLVNPGNDEVLFSLAPGSPTIDNGFFGPGDILKSTFTGSYTPFVTAGQLGLTEDGATAHEYDNVDALDIRPREHDDYDDDYGDEVTSDTVIIRPKIINAMMINEATWIDGHIYIGHEFGWVRPDMCSMTVGNGDTTIPCAAIYIDRYPGLTPPVMMLTFHLADFTQMHNQGLMWDCDARSYTVTGTDENGAISADDDFTYCGHTSGDLNLDHVVDIADLVFMVDYMFGGGDAPEILESADMNADGVVDIADMVHFVDWMFMGGDAPQHP